MGRMYIPIRITPRPLIITTIATFLIAAITMAITVDRRAMVTQPPALGWRLFYCF